jgi:hypothetical protein
MKKITLIEPEGSETITIYGFKGERECYELLATIDDGNDKYHILTPYLSIAEIDSSVPYDAQVVKEIIKSNGMTAYNLVEDDELADELFNMFQEEREAKQRLKYGYS